MRTWLVILLLVPASASAQHDTVKHIMKRLSALNKEVVDHQCGDESAMIITNRGLNYFFANKIGSYLSETGDISLYKNYATLNTAGGEFSINHNFGKLRLSGPLPPLSAIGFKAKLADGFASVFSGEQLGSDMGLVLKRTWFSRGITYFGNCPVEENGVKDPRPTQKALMNARRSFLLHQLEIEMNERSREFEIILEKMRPEEFENSGELEAAREYLRQHFYSSMSGEYERKFAQMEAKAFGGDSSYNIISSAWTTIMVYIPVTAQKFSIAPAFTESFATEELYSWKVNLNYSEFIESRTAGRFLVFYDMGLFNNNSIHTKTVSKYKMLEYKNNGGVDTLHFAELNIREAWLGAYNKFITPYIKLQVVWFPVKSNAGASMSIEKNFGKYHPFNARVGIPLRFNDRLGNPSLNFELQLRAFDLGNTISHTGFSKKLSVGFSVGLPFSNRLF